MSIRPAALAAGVLALAAAPAAHAAWSTPVTVDRGSQSNPTAQGAFGGSVLTGWFDPVVSLAKRTGAGFGPPQAITAPDPAETVWDAALDAGGNAVVVTLRKHAPVQRVRATFVYANGVRSGTATISDHAHTASSPELAVAPDGTAVAAWDWHDPSGWRAQVAIRRPGQRHFDPPQNVSPPGPTLAGVQQRPWISVAAGPAGRAVVSWQIGGDYQLPEAPLHVRIAGPDGAFGPDRALSDAGGLADVAMAVGAAGDVVVAYLDEHFVGHEGPSSLHVSRAAPGGELSDPVVLSRGGMGTSSGPQLATAFSPDGTATVAWARPGANYEEGGALEVFTEPPGGAFGAAQQVAAGAQGVVLAAGPGQSAVLAWMREATGNQKPAWTVHAALRPGAGGPFAPEQTISSLARNALWPSVAMTPAGDAVATWVTNTDGSGGGQVAASVAPGG